MDGSFNTPAIVLIARQNKTTIVIDRTVLLTRNLSKSEAQKIRKYENLALKIENVWKLNKHIYPKLSYLGGCSGQQTFLNKYIDIIISQSTTQFMYICKIFHNDMFRPIFRPSSGCSLA